MQRNKNKNKIQILILKILNKAYYKYKLNVRIRKEWRFLNLKSHPRLCRSKIDYYCPQPGRAVGSDSA